MLAAIFRFLLMRFYCNCTILSTFPLVLANRQIIHLVVPLDLSIAYFNHLLDHPCNSHHPRVVIFSGKFVVYSEMVSSVKLKHQPPLSIAFAKPFVWLTSSVCLL